MNLTELFLHWKASQPTEPPKTWRMALLEYHRDADTVTVETSSSGMRTESHWRKGETAPYMTITSLPYGANWASHWTDEPDETPPI